MAKDTEKKRNKKKGGWFYVIALVVFVAVYLSVSFLLSLRNTYSTVVVKKGELEDFILAEGYVFKNSTVIYAEKEGYIDCLKEDEEKVKVGEAIVALYNEQVNSELKGQIISVDEKIESLEKTIKYKSSSDGDLAKTEQSISDKIKSVGALSDAKDIKQISQLKKDVVAMLHERNNLSGESEEKELEALRNQRNSLMTTLKSQADIIYAQGAGVFTSFVDGAEEVLSIKNIEENKVDRKYIKNLKSFKYKNKVSSKVAKGEPVGKLVDNYNWNVVMEVPKAESELISVGDAVKIRFTELDENAVSGTVLKISPEEDGKVIVIVKSNKYINSVYQTSKTEVQLIKKTYQGVKIPQKALRIVDGEKGVYVSRGNLAKFIPVNIIYSDKDWVVAEEGTGQDGIKIYDQVILKGKNLYDKKVIK